MNKKPLRPCSKFNCSNLTQARYCDEHKQEFTKSNRYYDRFHRSDRTKKFYHSAAWKRAREIIKIRDNGLCQFCFKNKRITVGSIVDHVIPVKVNWSLRLTEDNLQLLCQSCHNKKTAEEQKEFFR